MGGYGGEWRAQVTGFSMSLAGTREGNRDEVLVTAELVFVFVFLSINMSLSFETRYFMSGREDRERILY